MSNEIKWASVQKHLDPDRVYYAWTAKFQSREDEYALVSQTRLVTILFAGDVWELRLICGHSGCKDEDDRRMIRFGRDPLYRILEGPRKGYLRPVEVIEDGEPACPADGLITTLMPEDTAASIAEDLRETDPSWYLAYLNLYQDFVSAGPERPDEQDPFIPEFYMSRRDSSMVNLADLHISDDEDTEEAFRAHPKYDPDKTPETNRRLLKPLFGKAAPEGRVVFPWRHFYGRGVPVVDVESFSEWHSVPIDRSYVAYTGVEVDLGG